MRVLRVGMSGEDVRQWQHFLRGRNFKIVADGEFGPATEKITKKFQKDYLFINDNLEETILIADGVVGPMTLSTAFQNGFCPLEDPDESEFGPNWPEPPDFKALTFAQRQSTFGKIEYVPAPTSRNPEGVKITNDWQSKFLTKVKVPQLAGVDYAPRSCNIFWNKAGVDQLLDLWAHWEKEKLLKYVRTWAASWNARFVRGSKTTLSNHAHAVAFDINAPWNGLGQRPALKGSKGSVRELVEIANEHGFWWGGHWKNRPDGMHFELAKIS